MKKESIILIACLLLSHLAHAGRSPEEMGVKLNQKKPEASQPAAADSSSGVHDESKVKNTQSTTDKATEDTVKTEQKKEN